MIGLAVSAQTTTVSNTSIAVTLRQTHVVKSRIAPDISPTDQIAHADKSPTGNYPVKR